MKFSDVIGNDEVKDRLRALIDNDRMPHATLIYGPPGTCKLKIALAAAQYIHCQNRVNGEPCGVCRSCLQHQSFNHPDTIFSYPEVKRKKSTKAASETISADYCDEWKHFISTNDTENYEAWQSEIKSDNSQLQMYVSESDAIIHTLNLSTYSSNYKVLIMWLPEKMGEECANKLLKIIEEPFSDTIFLLVSDNQKEILPTIFSRTQRIEVKRLSTADIAGYLVAKYNVDNDNALALAAYADGNLISAVEALSLDSESKDFFMRFVTLMRMAFQRDIVGLKRWSEEVADYKREKEKRFMQYCVRLLRENFIFNLGNPTLNYMTNEERNFSVKFAPFINERNVEQMVAEFNIAETDIQGNCNAKIVLFDLALKITKLIRK